MTVDAACPPPRSAKSGVTFSWKSARKGPTAGVAPPLGDDRNPTETTPEE
jgi:hypothetical protein